MRGFLERRIRANNLSEVIPQCSGHDWSLFPAVQATVVMLLRFLSFFLCLSFFFFIESLESHWTIAEFWALWRISDNFCMADVEPDSPL